MKGRNFKPVKQTGRVIDFRKTAWGYNFSTQQKFDDGSFRVAVWMSPGPKVGDLVRWDTAYGYCDLIVNVVDPCRDPLDMYFLNLAPVARYNNEGERLDA